jgi:hypothetical protein
MAERDPDDVVRLMTAANPVEAHVVEQALRDEGIESRVVGDYLGAGIGDVPGLRPEVWVHRDDFETAQSVLEKRRAAPADEDENEPGA